MRNRSLRERPENFRLKTDHSLAQKLVFAGLGRVSGDLKYVDSSVYGNHGTLTAMDPSTDWSWIPTLNRFALDFDATDDYVNCGSTPITDDIRPLTVSAWVKARSRGESSCGHIVSKGGLFLSGSWVFCVYYGGLRLLVEAGTDLYHNVSIDFDISANQIWKHVLITWTGGTTAATDIQLYVNSIVISPTQLQDGVSLVSDAALNLSIGGKAGAYTFDGQISDPMIWNRILSSSEIQQLADPSNTMLSGLLLPPKRKLYSGITLEPIPPTPSTTRIRRNRLFKSPIFSRE